MDLESILQVLPFVMPFITGFFAGILGYYLGLRSQKIQIRQKYITDTVKEQYPSLYSEMQRNSEYVENFLEKPIVTFEFPVLTEFYKKGLESLMKRHHADLFQTVNHFVERIQPKFEELGILRDKIHNELYKIWQPYIRDHVLAGYPEWLSEIIGNCLIRTDNKYNVLSELLSYKRDSAAQKVEKCITEERMAYYEGDERRRIKGIPVGDMNFQDLTKSLVELAKPKVENILNVYVFLKEQNGTEIKGKMIPLLNRYIGNPV